MKEWRGIKKTETHKEQQSRTTSGNILKSLDTWIFKNMIENTISTKKCDKSKNMNLRLSALNFNNSKIMKHSFFRQEWISVHICDRTWSACWEN